MASITPETTTADTRLGPAKSLGIVACLVLVGQLSGMLTLGPGRSSFVRLGAGIGVAILVFYGLRHWYLILVSAFINLALNYLQQGTPHALPASNIAICLICLGQTLLASWLIRRRIGSRVRFRLPNEVLEFYIIVALSTLAGATVANLVMRLAGIPSGALASLLHWWLAHLVGIGASAPLVLLWLDRDTPPWTRTQWLRNIGHQIILISALIWAASAQSLNDPRVIYRLDLLILPMILIAALGFGPRNGSLATVLVLLVEAIMLTTGRGWIALTTGDDAAAAFQVLVLVIELSGAYAGALSSRYRDVADALSESQDRYRALVDDAPIGIVVAQGGRFTYANQTAADIMAAPDPNALIGFPMIPESTGRAVPQEPPLIGSDPPNDHKHASTTLHIHRLDGQAIEVEMVITPVTYAGQPASQIIFSDVTERRRADKALRRSEQRFSTIFEASPYLVVLTDTETLQIVDINSSGCEMVGRTRDELVGRLQPESGIWKDPEAYAGLRGLLQTHHRFADRRVTLAHKDGHEIKAILSSEIVIIDDRPMALTVGVDISDQVMAQEALAASEERHRLISTLIADIAYEAHLSDDLALAVDWATGGIEAITGYPRDQFQRIEMNRRAFHPDDLGIAKTHLGRALAGQGSEAEFRIRRADGSYCWIRNSVRPQRDAEGKITHLLGAAKDINVQRGLEDQLLQSQKMEAVGRLAGGIAHDFNNLLTVINGYAEMTAMALGSQHPLQGDVSEIRRAGERAAELTRQLLAFSRSEMRQVQPLGLNQLVKGMRRMLDPLLREDINMVMDLAPDLGIIHGDPTQLEQVLLNLVLNARDALAEKTPPGGRLEIRTRDIDILEPFHAYEHVVPAGPYVELIVQDSGVGIPSEVREHLFEPFFTTKEVGHGTGLGLATVYGIVRQNGGFVTVDSVEGEGSTFRVGWPRSELQMESTPKAEEPKVVEGGSGSLLLVEDADNVRKLTTSMLERLGFGVTQAASGAEALSLLADPSLRVDLLLTDMIMPEMGGEECARRARQMRASLPVLFMTGHSDDLVNLNHVDDGAPILPKPFDRQQLSEAIRDVLEPNTTRD